MKNKENALTDYINEKHTQEECIGFIDGFDKGVSFKQYEVNLLKQDIEDLT